LFCVLIRLHFSLGYAEATSRRFRQLTADVNLTGFVFRNIIILGFDFFNKTEAILKNGFISFSEAH